MRTIRIIIGYVVSITLFALVIPQAVIALGGGIDAVLGIPRWIPTSSLNITLTTVFDGWGGLWMIWSWWTLVARGRGHPTEAFGIEVTPVTQRLVTSGPYAYVRNPMVFGYLFVLLAIAAFYGSAGMLAAIALFAAVGWIQIVYFEEPRLEMRFGDAYREYKRRVPRFVPLRFGRR